MPTRVASIPSNCGSSDSPGVELGNARMRRRGGTGQWEGLIAIRWALLLMLALALFFALTFGYHFGTAYVQDLIAR